MEIVPSEAVVGIFEVKRTLNEKTLQSAIKHLENIFDFVPLQKNRKERYLPGGIQLADSIIGGKLSNPLIGILSLQDKIPKKTKTIPLRWFIDLAFCFDGYFQTYKNPDKDANQIFSFIEEKDLLQRRSLDVRRTRDLTKEKVLQGFVGYLNKYLNEVCERNYDMNDYFLDSATPKNDQKG